MVEVVKKFIGIVYQFFGVLFFCCVGCSYMIWFWFVCYLCFLEVIYNLFVDFFLKFYFFWNVIGYSCVEKLVKFIECNVKGLFFDCCMCGQCVLFFIGMSCLMNCLKQFCNGFCGGVCVNGNCEVELDMFCVWVQVWKGLCNMEKGDVILNVQKLVDQLLCEIFVWLCVIVLVVKVKEVFVQDKGVVK